MGLQILKDQAESKLKETERKQQVLSDNLLSNILQFESYSNARNYAGMLRSQIRLLETWIEAKDGLTEAEQMVRDMTNTKKQLEQALAVVSQVRHNGQRSGASVPPQPHAQFRPQRRAGQTQPQHSGGGFFGSLFR